MKTCAKCSRLKSLTDFYKEKKSEDGHTCWCKNCMRQNSRDDYNRNTEEWKARAKKWKKEHKREIQEYSKKYSRSHKDEKQRWWKRFLHEHGDEHNARRRNARKSEDARRKAREYVAQKRAIDPSFRMADNLRRRVNSALRGNAKSDATFSLVGCSIRKLRKHLEYQFQQGMTWDNYGKWHVDHKKPCAFFDLSVSSQQRECFNYTNLQPLWAAENLSKGKTRLIGG